VVALLLDEPLMEEDRKVADRQPDSGLFRASSNRVLTGGFC
jgi:hypothetical protein